MRVWLCWVVTVFAVAGCGEKDTPYVAAVRDELPVYCYKTLAGVDCYAKPDFRDERQLINFYGPPPRDYERPEPVETARLDPPPEVDFYCRVSEPDACPLTAAPAPANAGAEPEETLPSVAESGSPADAGSAADSGSAAVGPPEPELVP